MLFDPEELAALRKLIEMKRKKKEKVEAVAKQETKGKTAQSGSEVEDIYEIETECDDSQGNGNVYDLGENKYQKGPEAVVDEKAQQIKETKGKTAQSGSEVEDIYEIETECDVSQGNGNVYDLGENKYQKGPEAVVDEKAQQIKETKGKTAQSGSEVEDIYEIETECDVSQGNGNVYDLGENKYQKGPEAVVDEKAQQIKETKGKTAQSGSEVEDIYEIETECDVSQGNGNVYVLGENKYQKGPKAVVDEKAQKIKAKETETESDEESSVEPISSTDEELASSEYEMISEDDDNGIQTDTISKGRPSQRSTNDNNGVYTKTKQEHENSTTSGDDSNDKYTETKQGNDNSKISTDETDDKYTEIKQGDDNSNISTDDSDDKYTETKQGDDKSKTPTDDSDDKYIETKQGMDKSKTPTDDSDDKYIETKQGDDNSKTSTDDSDDKYTEAKQRDDNSKTSTDDSDDKYIETKQGDDNSKTSTDDNDKTYTETNQGDGNIEISTDDNDDKSTDSKPEDNNSERFTEGQGNKYTETRQGDGSSKRSTDDSDGKYTETEQEHDKSHTSTDNSNDMYIETKKEDDCSDTSTDNTNDKYTETKQGDDNSKTPTDDSDDKYTETKQRDGNIEISTDDYDDKSTDSKAEDKNSERFAEGQENKYTKYKEGVGNIDISTDENDDKSTVSKTEDENSENSTDEQGDKYTENKQEDERSDPSTDDNDDKYTGTKYGEEKKDRSKYDNDYKDTETEPGEENSDSLIEDESDSEQADIKRYPKVFEISITAEEFDQMRPSSKSVMEKKKLQFVKGWTHILADKFSIVNPACILKFKYHKVQERKKHSKRDICYFFTKAECKHENCGIWTMKIEKEPKRGRRVFITVIQTKSVVKHKRSGHHKRQLSSTLRRKAQSKMQKESVQSVYWTEYKRMPEDELKAKNYTKCQSETILRKAKSETRTGDLLHPEPFTELVILKEVFDANEAYIQEVSYIPFMTVLYSEDSVNVAKNTIRNGSGVFYLDATGQVVKKLNQKRVLYYSMIINETNMPVVPVLEYISDHHATHYILRPLLSFRAALGPKIVPRRIEVDFSWAIIHSVLLTFNYMSIHEYLLQCYQACTQHGEFSFMVVHVCCVHILRAVRVTVKEKVKDKKMREIILRMIALLQNTTSLRQAVSVWRIFCTVLSSSKKTKAVDKAVGKMNTMFKDASLQSIDSEEDNICTEDHGESGLIGKDKKEKLGIRDRSPFRPLFIQYLVEAEVGENDELAENIYFQKEMINHIGQNYMPLYPLWSGCMLEEGKSRDSNASVEAWMKIVKKDVLIGKKNLRTGEFVRTLRPVVGGRLRRVKIEQEEKGTARKTRKRKMPAEDIQETEELWAKKSKGKERTSFLYSPAETVPVPKTKRKTQAKRPTKKTSYSDAKRKEKKDKNPPGLVNKGNSCWLNSTLQAVAAMKQLNCEGDDRISVEAKIIIDQLRKLKEQDNQIDPEDLREAAWMDLSLARGQQQDGAEFVQDLMHRNNQKLMHLQHTRTCRVCKLETVTEEETNLVSVELASVRPASVSDCLLEFGKEEMLIEEDAPLCKNCKKNTTHSTHTAITRAEVLLINMKRFRLAKSGRHLKENRYIRVNRVIGLKDVGVYKLRAVQAFLAFYVNETSFYITVTVDDEWTCRRCDDTRVTIAHPAIIDGTEVQKSSYVLYYETMAVHDAHVLIRNLPDVSLALCGDIELMGLDMSSLLPGEKLNDQVLNAYMSMIARKFQTVAAMDIFFSHCLVWKRDPGKLVRDDMFLRQMVLVPFIYREHWTLLVIRPATHSISVYDSADGGDEPANLLVKYLLERDGVTYKVRNVKDLPKQKNSKDCGVFVCHFALALASKQTIRFNNARIGYLRKKMLFECLASTLL